MFKYPSVGCGIARRRIAQRGLIHAQHFVHVIDPIDPIVGPRLEIRAMQRSGQRGIENAVDKAALAAATRPRDRSETPKRNADADVPKGVGSSSLNGQPTFSDIDQGSPITT